jgi:hypothetical protein
MKVLIFKHYLLIQLGMKLNFTCNHHPKFFFTRSACKKIEKSVLFLFIALYPFAAQSQNTNIDLEERMQALYDRAAQLYANLPNRDFRGNYLTLSFGVSPFGHIEKWRIQEECDCEGNVKTRTVTSDKAPISLGIGLERRISNVFSLRFMGNYATLSHGKGQNVMAQNGTYAHMLQDYSLSQYGLNGSILLYSHGFYGGAGVSYTSTRTSGYKTDAEIIESKTPQYFDLKAQVLRPFQTDYAPHVFVGYRQMMSPAISGSFEAGVAQSFYLNVQLNFTLLASTKASLTHWQIENEYYKSVRQQAISLDMSLHPAKFQSSDCTIIDSGGSSNSCRR